jgi:hypothetical protein
MIISGYARTGKTTYAKRLAKENRVTLRHTDDTIGDDFREAIEQVVKWLDEPGPWIIEGCTAVHAVRKWCERNPQGKPCDVFEFRTHPFLALSEGQVRQAKGLVTAFNRCLPHLVDRGAAVVRE